ncbi:sigma-70 family RNA polymerase sigma factor [Stenotrophomonas sp. CFBP 13718]|uniref:RNA polymerase sigma factor n=1 Tax=Stenotrophomonas sp. CFBP 13718 TaxID=2775304 RepID=UPI00177C6F47|nr:sigma-70 family RNA polymerase sigma factor [Stenotrophomonas sp. CFBP 13718]MBD8696720.1 sigma-70 family RNA polymerase sigma factor [Stenotrophomonas sp. CFBP 13718]
MTTVAAPFDDVLHRELPAAAEGCQHAYGRIVQACQNTVTAIALAITRDREASEDIAQDAFVRGWQQLQTLRNPSSFMPWLRQITRNLARDWLRRQRGRPLSGDAADLAIQMAADPSPDAADRLQQIEEETAAEDIISALPEDSREVLLLYYREGQRSQHVANLLGLSDAAVRKRLSRARGMVREGLLQRFGEFARSTAPSAAFATAVVSTLMVVAPGTASAAIVLGTVGAGGTKLGLGGASATGGTALGSLTAAASQLPVFADQLSVGATIGAVVGGTTFSYLGGRYLMSFAESPQERTQIRRFVYLNTLTALVVCITVLALSLLAAPVWVGLFALFAGLSLVCWQCLVPLRQIMQPLIDRDAERRGRQGKRNWTYEAMYGKQGMLGAGLGALIVVGALLWRNGSL